MDEEPQQIRSEEVRKRLRTLLNAVERDGKHITILRYDSPAAVLVPVEWHREKLAEHEQFKALAADPKEQQR